MNTQEEMTDLNDALDDLRDVIEVFEKHHGPIHQLRHFAAVERGRSFGTGCHDYWCQSAMVLDALANWRISDEAHDAQHPMSLFGVEGKHQEDGSMRFDFGPFDVPKEPA